MSVMAIFRQSSFSMGGFGLESGADDRVLPRAAVVSCLRTPVRLGSREASRIQRMVESEAQDEKARTQSLHDPRPANGASLEPADTS
jgi:hypothetical protein